MAHSRVGANTQDAKNGHSPQRDEFVPKARTSRWWVATLGRSYTPPSRFLGLKLAPRHSATTACHRPSVAGGAFVLPPECRGHLHCCLDDRAQQSERVQDGLAVDGGWDRKLDPFNAIICRFESKKSSRLHNIADSYSLELQFPTSSNGIDFEWLLLG